MARGDVQTANDKVVVYIYNRTEISKCRGDQMWPACHPPAHFGDIFVTLSLSLHVLQVDGNEERFE